MAVRLVASDLDGTLFGPDHVPAQRTVDESSYCTGQAFVVDGGVHP